MKKTILKILKNIFIFISYFKYTYLFLFILSLFKIDIYKFEISKRIIAITIFDLLFIIFLLIMYRKELKEDFKDFKENYKKYLPNYINIYFIGVILMGICNIILSKLTGNLTSGNEEAIRNYIGKYPLYMVYSSVIFAPLVEELIFRKNIRNIFKNKYLFIIMSGFIFGALHITNYTDIKELLFGIPYIIMGLDFAYIYYKTNNIYTTMTYHFGHNLLLMIIQLIKLI